VYIHLIWKRTIRLLCHRSVLNLSFKIVPSRVEL
jgi:hypothetical protein